MAQLQSAALDQAPPVQRVSGSELAAQRSVAAVWRARVSKIWRRPSISQSYACRQLRGEAPIPLTDWTEGLQRLVHAGHGRIAREAVQPIIDLVTRCDSIGSANDEAADVAAWCGELQARFLRLACDADGLTRNEAAELLGEAERLAVEVSELIESLRRVAEGQEVRA